ncbi:MAG: hypothetical protein ACR2PM_17405 [Hyphomicrobiales bacterium]
MSDRQGQDSRFDDELSFELREMLHMLGRIENADEPADAATPDVADDVDLDAFAL